MREKNEERKREKEDDGVVSDVGAAVCVREREKEREREDDVVASALGAAVGV